VSNGDVSVEKSQFEASATSGVCLDVGATLVMTGTQLIDNQEYALDVFDASAQFSLGNLTVTGNMSDTIGIQGGTMTGVHFWSAEGINTYDIHNGSVTIAPTGFLYIKPGVIVRFG
jgi:hypothetical protein